MLTKQDVKDVITEEYIKILIEALDPSDLDALEAAAAEGPKALKSVYRDLIRKYHPDRSSFPEAEANQDASDLNRFYDDLQSNPSANRPPERENPGTEVSPFVDEPESEGSVEPCQPGDVVNIFTGEPCDGQGTADSGPSVSPGDIPGFKPSGGGGGGGGANNSSWGDSWNNLMAQQAEERARREAAAEQRRKEDEAHRIKQARLDKLERDFISKIRNRKPMSFDQIRLQYEKMITGEIGLPDIGGSFGPGSYSYSTEWPEKDISTDEEYATKKDFDRAVKRQKKKIDHAMAKFDYERNQAYQEWKAEQEDNKSQYVAETFSRWGELIK